MFDSKCAAWSGSGRRGQAPTQQGSSTRLARPLDVNSSQGRLDDRRVCGDPLLEQQFGGSDNRLEMEAAGIGSSSKALVRATRLIPWWWAMYDLTTTWRWPRGNRSGM